MTTKAPPRHHRAGPFSRQILVKSNDAVIVKNSDGQHSMLGKRFRTAALTFFRSAGVPCCATRASAVRALGDRILSRLIPSQ